VDAQMAGVRSNASINDHVEVRMANGDLRSGRLEGKMAGQIEVRQFRQGAGYVSVPIPTKDVSHVRVSSKPWLNTNSPTGWVRQDSAPHVAFQKSSGGGSRSRAAGMTAKQVTTLRRAEQTGNADKALARMARPKAPSAPKLSMKPGTFANPTRQRSPFGLGYNASGTPRKPSGSV